MRAPVDVEPALQVLLHQGRVRFGGLDLRCYQERVPLAGSIAMFTLGSDGRRDLTEFRAPLTTTGYSHWTIHNYISSVREYLRYLAETTGCQSENRGHDLPDWHKRHHPGLRYCHHWQGYECLVRAGRPSKVWPAFDVTAVARREIVVSRRDNLRRPLYHFRGKPALCLSDGSCARRDGPEELSRAKL